MKILIPVVAALSLVVALSCSKKDEESKSSSPPASAGNKTAKPTTPAVKAKTKAPAKVLKVVKKVVSKALKADKFGAFGIARCAIDGAPMLDKSFAKAVGDIAATADAVFVVDNNGAVRRYKIKPGAECVLSLDDGFADKGVLKTAKKIDAIAVNAKGTLHLVTDRKLSRYVNGKLDAFCKADFFATSSLAFIDESSMLVSGFGGKWTKLDLSAAPCKQTPWAYSPKLKFSDADVVGGQVIMTGKQTIQKKRELHAFAPTGGASATKFDTAETISEDNVLCNSAGAFGCGKGVCVVDNNCRKLMVFGADGKFVQNVKFDRATFGSSNIWVTMVDQSTPDIAFMAVSSKQKAKDADPKAKKLHQGYIYRISGLATK